MVTKWATFASLSITTQIASLPLGERGNILPFPHGDLQWFQQSSWPLMLSLHFLTYTTRSHIFSNINPHPLPLEALLQILIHLCLTRVHCIWTAMSFPPNLHLYCGFLWYTKATSEKIVPSSSILNSRGLPTSIRLRTT